MTAAIGTNNAAFDQAISIAQSQKLQKPSKSDIANIDKINETAQEFESVFLSEMMSHMFKDIQVDELFGGGHGEEMFKSMVTRQYGKEMAAQGGIGLAKHVSAQMIRLQEMQN